ncbi:MAG: sulfotransferase [Acidimicrobiia bacterium]
MPTHPMLSTRPVFVVGMGRSGTTLLRSLISMHPLLQLAPETHFLSYWMWRYRGADLSKEDDFGAFWSAFTGHERFALLELDADEVRRRILGEGTPSFKSIFTTLLVSHARGHGKPGWGEKTPNHFQHVDQLFEWYPEARIVFTIRDPRGVVASWLRLERRWTQRPIDEIAASWRESIYEADRWTGDRRVRIVRYEDLLRDADGELRSLFDFVGVDFPAAEFAARDRVAAEAGARPGPDGVVNAEATDRWRETLTPAQIAAAERRVGYEMLRHGYEPDSEVPSFAGLRSAAKRRLYLLRRTRHAMRRASSSPPT